MTSPLLFYAIKLKRIGYPISENSLEPILLFDNNLLRSIALAVLGSKSLAQRGRRLKNDFLDGPFLKVALLPSI